MAHNLNIALNDGKTLLMTPVGYCRLSALCDGLEAIWSESQARGMREPDIRWDMDSELVAYVVARGDDLYHSNV